MPMWRVFLVSRPTKSPKTPAVSAQSPDDALKRINELSGLAQTAFFSLLGALAVFIVVLLSTSDADFFIESRTTTLPLIGVDVSAERFVSVTSGIVTFLYFYLHYFCLRLWSKVCKTKPDDLQGINPSLISDLALGLKEGADPRGGNDWGIIGIWATALLIWALEPLVLVWAWRQSVADGVMFKMNTEWLRRIPFMEEFPAVMPIDGLQLAIVLCLVASMLVGMLSLLTALNIRREEPLSHGERLATTTYAVAVAALALLWLIPARPVDIERENLVELDGHWALAAERRESFRRQWCKEEGIGFASEPAGVGVCGNMPGARADFILRVDSQRRFHCASEKKRWPGFCDPRFKDLDRRFDTAWMAQRRAELDRLPELDLSERDLDHASAEGAIFVAARLLKASLSAADVRHANFEGADLIDASLTNTNANFAGFDRADLTRADLSGADSNFTSATFEGAYLISTNLEKAQLINALLVAAELRGANLTGTDLKNARLHRSNLTGAILDGADLTGATGLTQSQLKFAVGDEKTKLPSSPPALWIWSCWPTLPEGIRDLRRNDELERKFAKRICRPGQAPEMIPPLATTSKQPMTTPDRTRAEKADQTARYLGKCNLEKERLAVALAYAIKRNPYPPYTRAIPRDAKAITPPAKEILAKCRREIERLRLALESARRQLAPEPQPADQTALHLANCNHEKERLAVALAYATATWDGNPDTKPITPAKVLLAECRPEIDDLRLALEAARQQPAAEPQPSAIVPVLFDLGSADLGSGAERRVGELAASLQGRELARIRVVGHTDRLGPMAFNLRLAEKRARAVASFLEAKGVAPGLIETMPMPEFRAPILTGDGVSEPLNRAVEIIPFGRVPPPPPRPSEPPVTMSARDLPLQ